GGRRVTITRFRSTTLDYSSGPGAWASGPQASTAGLALLLHFLDALNLVGSNAKNLCDTLGVCRAKAAEGDPLEFIALVDEVLRLDVFWFTVEVVNPERRHCACTSRVRMACHPKDTAASEGEPQAGALPRRSGIEARPCNASQCLGCGTASPRRIREQCRRERPVAWTIRLSGMSARPGRTSRRKVSGSRSAVGLARSQRARSRFRFAVVFPCCALASGVAVGSRPSARSLARAAGPASAKGRACSRRCPGTQSLHTL